MTQVLERNNSTEDQETNKPPHRKSILNEAKQFLTAKEYSSLIDFSEIKSIRSASTTQKEYETAFVAMIGILKHLEYSYDEIKLLCDEFPQSKELISCYQKMLTCASKFQTSLLEKYSLT